MSFMMQFELAKLSKAGGRQVNEDDCDYWRTSTIVCCVLSDGLGGHFGGDIASKLVISSAYNAFQETQECSVSAIESILRASDKAIIQQQQKNRELRHMRATTVVLLIDADRHLAAWGHVGDSRLYCFRNNKIIQQTRDHSVCQKMIEAGYLKTEELRFSPERNQLYAALGDSEHFEADIVSTEFSIVDGDVFLLCSDGLWEYVEENVMEFTLSSSGSASEWLEILERQVLARGHKGQDNYSAVVLWCNTNNSATSKQDLFDLAGC